MKNKNYLVVSLSLFLIILSVLGSMFLESSQVSITTGIISATTAVLGATALLIEYRKNSRINASNFLINFNSSFYSAGSLAANLETILDNDYLGFKEYTITAKDSEMVVKYLCWLKTLSEIICNKVVRIEDVDDLFGYKFFVIVNNSEVQKLFLVPSAGTFRKIYRIHKMWKDYRIKNNIPLIKNETDLSKTEVYSNYII